VNPSTSTALIRSAIFLALVISLAGCGGSEQPPREPKIPSGLARDLAAKADEIAAALEAGDPCGAKEQAIALQGDVANAIAAGRVPRIFHRELVSAVDDLVQIECVAPEPPPSPAEEPDSCAALEERKAELDAEKEAIDEIEDEKERKEREQEIEAEKKAVEEQLKACEEAEKDDEALHARAHPWRHSSSQGRRTDCRLCERATGSAS
jgi:hypothetical protein